MKNKKTIISTIVVVVILFVGLIISAKSEKKGGAFGTDILNNFAQTTTSTVATSTGIGNLQGKTTLLSSVNSPALTAIVNTGNAPVINAVIASITVPFICSTGLIPTISPANQITGLLATSSNIYATSTATNQFVLESGTVGLTGTTTYAWNIYVACY